jgi:hypothetical protein
MVVMASGARGSLRVKDGEYRKEWAAIRPRRRGVAAVADRL